jgi:hypothetical protein
MDHPAAREREPDRELQGRPGDVGAGPSPASSLGGRGRVFVGIGIDQRTIHQRAGDHRVAGAFGHVRPGEVVALGERGDRHVGREVEAEAGRGRLLLEHEPARARFSWREREAGEEHVGLERAAEEWMRFGGGEVGPTLRRFGHGVEDDARETADEVAADEQHRAR